MSYPTKLATLELEREGDWLSIWLNRPESRNALSSELAGELQAVLDGVRDDRSVRGITLRGRGGVFCAGGDMKAFQAAFQPAAEGGARAAVVEISKSGASLFDAVNAMPQVVVALVEGAAMAGGLGLACCADIVIAETEARFSFSETAIGLTPAQIAPFVIQKVGYAPARRLMLTAARFDGVEAARIGLADIVAKGVSAADEAERAVRKQVLRCAPGAVASLKALIHTMPGLDRKAQINAAAENFADRIFSDEGREGVSSFIEKRKPVWAEEA